jgi:hypothetical protein
MELEDLQRKLSLASRHVFMKVNHDASQMKKKDVDPEVYILVDGKKHKLIEVGVLNQDIILETEKE